MPKDNRLPLLPGTLEMLVLQSLVFGSRHGHGIATTIQRTSDELLLVDHGSLYPALQRLERAGLIASAWGISDNNRRARFYKLTRAGRKKLVAETGKWEQTRAGSQGCLAGTARGGTGMKWFGRGDRDYREELDAHLEMEVRENLDRGMSPHEARQAALRTFGNALAVRQQLAEARPLHFWQTLSQDVRYGARLLKRSPGLTATIVFTLALGIGANAAIFSLVEAVLLRMLPVREPHSLVIVRALSRQGARDSFSHTDYEWLRDHNRAFSAMSASAVWKMTLDAGDHKERVTAELVSGNYFTLLGVEPAAGRTITVDDDHQGRLVAVLSHAFWQRSFAGRDDALGRNLRLDGASLAIVGVAPPGFEGEFAGNPPDFWIPLGVQPALSGRRAFDPPYPERELAGRHGPSPPRGDRRTGTGGHAASPRITARRSARGLAE